jgi:uncharacterized protein
MPHAVPLRLVLDTNTVMALWFFEDPRLVPLRRAIDDSPLLLVARADALEELRRVLAYRQFGASPEIQAAILGAYTARVVTIAADAMPDAEAPAATLPACRDRDDQKFLEIARDGNATHLISRDKALLRLNRHRLLRPLFAVVTPEAFVAALLAD